MKRMLPFSGTSYLEQGPKEAISSALGIPIYGHPKVDTYEGEQAAKQKKREQSKARDAARKQKRIDSLTGGQ